VNGWFTATKRPLAACASPEALGRLKREHGLTILYQYLFRYADSSTLRLNEAFVRSIETISSDPEILVATLSAMMKRLRLIQGTFVTFGVNAFWLINTNDERVNDLQIALDRHVAIEQDSNTKVANRMIHVKNLPPRSLLEVRESEKISFRHKGAVPLPGDRHVTWNLPSGKLRANLADAEWHTPNGAILPPASFTLESRRTRNGVPLLSELSAWEEAMLVCGQVLIIAREAVLKGRSLRTDKYLDSSRPIRLEDHDNW
jgi:hypothetical protein